jgi:Ca-activated chloride channel family protein
VKRVLIAALALLFAPASAHAQDGKPIVGGGSFNTAPLLAPGTYADTVAAGETVYWKIRLAKGQQLTAKATVDVSQIETEAGKPDFEIGLDLLDYKIDIFTPLREPLSGEYDAEYRKASADLEGDDGTGVKTGTATSPRVLGFEQILQGDYNVAKFPAPGDWYVAVSVADSDVSPAEQPVELPLELELGVDGAAQASSPNFASKLATPTPEPTQEPELASATTDPGSPAVTILLVAVLALLGGVGLGALAARVLPR